MSDGQARRVERSSSCLSLQLHGRHTQGSANNDPSTSIGYDFLDPPMGSGNEVRFCDSRLRSIVDISNNILRVRRGRMLYATATYSTFTVHALVQELQRL